jgi:hypothetical protein
MAINWAVCVGDATDCEPGITEMEAMLVPVPPVGPPPPAAAVTVMFAVELTGPLNAFALAVIVVVPAPTAVITPEELTVATEGEVETQFTPLVTSLVERCFELPNVPITVSCAV